MLVPVKQTRMSDAETAMLDFVAAYDRAYEVAAEAHGLTVPQACVLWFVAEPMGMRQLADVTQCDASNITQIVARLERRGLVTRETDPDDRRSRRVTRTRAGAELSAGFGERFAYGREALARLTEAEQVELTRLLRKAAG